MKSRFNILKNGFNIHYVEKGSPENPTLVLLHGYPSNCLLWRNCIPPLSEKYHVIAPDLPGHGKSDKPGDAYYDIEFLTQFLIDFYESLGLEKPDLIAHDIGGIAALGFVTTCPERVNRFVIMDTAPYANWPFALKKMVQSLQKKWMAKATLRPKVFKQVLKRSLFYDPRKVDDEMVDIFLKPWNENKDGFKAFRQVIKPPPEHVTVSREKLKDISIPTLVLWAENDRFFPVSVAQKLAVDIPGATLKTIAQCGHFLPEEQPNLVVEHSLAFLNGD